MILGLLLGLALLGAVLARMRRRRLACACIGAALLALIVCGYGWAPQWLLNRLQTGYATHFSDWGARNAIVLLGAGSVRAGPSTIEPSLFAHGRMLRAVMLYRACKASGAECRIEASGGDPAKHAMPEAALYARQLRQLGVPAADLLLEPRSMNTWQNAQFSAPLLHTFAADRVLLVSSASHLRRANLYFRHFGIHAIPIRGDYLSTRSSWLPQAWNLALTDLALHEYAGIARYHVYQAMGWNVRATAPGSP